PPHVSFPMCTDGQPPLMELNDAFPCARGCPKGFNCEMQDSLLTPSMGICCANRTELRLLYGHDNEKHADPIWDRKGSPEPVTATATPPCPSLPITSVPDQAVETETDSYAPTTNSNERSITTIEADSPSSFPAPNNLYNETNSINVSTDDENFDETSSPEVTSDEESAPTDAPEATAGVAVAETNITAQSTMAREEESSSYQKGDNGLLEEQRTSTSVPQLMQPRNSSGDIETQIRTAIVTSSPVFIADPTSMTSNATALENAVEEDALEGSSDPVEDKASAYSTKTDSVEASIEEPNLVGTNTEVVPTLNGNQLTSNEPLIDTERNDATSSSPDCVGETAASGNETAEKSVFVEAVDVSSPNNETTGDSNDLDKDQILTDIIGYIENGTSLIEEEQTTYSCERQPYIFRCRSDSLDTQPTIRWYLNEKGECEYYPWGYCPGDRVVESSTIRTKLECERECMKRGNNRAEESLPGMPARFPNDDANAEGGPKSVTSESMEKYEEAMPGAAENKVTVGPSINTTMQKQSYDDLSTSMHGEVVSGTSDSANSVEKDHHEVPEVDNENATIPKTDFLPSVNDKAVNESSGQQDSVEAASHEELLAAVMNSTILETAKRSDVGDASGIVEEEALEGQESSSSTNRYADDTSPNATPGTETVNTSMIVSKDNELQQTVEKSASEITIEEGTNLEPINESIHNEAAVGKDIEDGVESGQNKNDPEEYVLCSRTTYRFLCESGMPSQFVYRWEMENGTCQSFPYGYCLSEWNHPHPRSYNECEQLCQI
ncbi:hypothetical protein GCK32_008370, partial [Trichostrongylus colubriformis]